MNKLPSFSALSDQLINQALSDIYQLHTGRDGLKQIKLLEVTNQTMKTGTSSTLRSLKRSTIDNALISNVFKKSII